MDYESTLSFKNVSTVMNNIGYKNHQYDIKITGVTLV